ncbi:hypothetical protein ABID56_002480 [Alkalibacillus flavidus]|uniref:Sporulation protein YtxC n=1 Tax=Alkalibacillus flavidus TaxID=546021 RepID=A0ABV2KXN6_9BACI
MQEKWLVNFEEQSYQLNIGTYSSLFVNYTTSESHLIDSVVNYFQPKSKVKDVMTIKDIQNDFTDVESQYMQAFQLSNEMIIEEAKIGSKSLLKQQMKHSLLNHVETDGYIQTINTLMEDLAENALPEHPISLKYFSVDAYLKMIEFNTGLMERHDDETNDFLNQAKVILPILKQYLKKSVTGKKMIFYMYPELYLSPYEQKVMKELLHTIGEDIPVFVVTKSMIFLTNHIDYQNYYIYDKQIFTNDLIEELEWHSPLDYHEEELRECVGSIMTQHINMFELNPLISNYREADIIVFDSSTLYVLVYMFMKMDFPFQLDLKAENIDVPVYKYVMEMYEKV